MYFIGRKIRIIQTIINKKIIDIFPFFDDVKFGKSFLKKKEPSMVFPLLVL